MADYFKRSFLIHSIRMAHAQQQNFMLYVKANFPEYFLNKSVLEIGSLDINGSVRTLFKNCNYLGVDLETGPGVDYVGQGQELTFPSNYYDTVISTECFEHNPFWIETFTNMIRMCKHSGLIIMTCATTGRPEHGTTRTSPSDSPFTSKIWNYYKNLTEQDFTQHFDIANIFKQYKFTVEHSSCDLYFYGITR